jgi:hypothetical protein
MMLIILLLNKLMKDFYQHELNELLLQYLLNLLLWNQHHDQISIQTYFIFNKTKNNLLQLLDFHTCEHVFLAFHPVHLLFDK